MEIYIDPRCRFNYTNYYILGLKHLYKTAKIVFDVSYFPRHILSKHLENNSSIPIIIDGKKIFIDADDKKKIDEEDFLDLKATFSQIKPLRNGLEHRLK